MDLVFKYDLNETCKVLIQEKLDGLDIIYTYTGLGEVKLSCKISDQKREELKTQLGKYGIGIVDNKKELLVQKIKNILTQMAYLDEEDIINKTSIHLTEKLNLSYGYLSNIFTEITMSTIANYIILQKIERAKTLLTKEALTLTEIAHKLNYSSVAHLSNQFKKKTGLTPTAFQRIIEKRKDNN